MLFIDLGGMNSETVKKSKAPMVKLKVTTMAERV
jgi:hypothetical protein